MYFPKTSLIGDCEICIADGMWFIDENCPDICLILDKDKKDLYFLSEAITSTISF